MSHTVLVVCVGGLWACSEEPAKPSCSAEHQGPCQITAGGVVIPEGTPPEVVVQILRLHEERPPALAALLADTDAAAGPAMRALLQSSSEEEVLGSLGWIRARGETVDPGPVAALSRHSLAAVRREAASTLRSMGARDHGAVLLPLLGDADVSVRLNALESVRRLGIHQAGPTLLGLMGDPSEQVALLAGRAAADLGGPEVARALQDMLSGGTDPHRVFSALWALRRLEVKVPMSQLVGALAAPDVRIAGEALKALSLHGDPGMRRLDRALGDPRPDVRRVALNVLTRYAPGRALPGAHAAISDVHPGVRAAALDALSRLQPAAHAARTLDGYVDDPEPEVRSLVVTRLGLLDNGLGARSLVARWAQERRPEVRRLILESLGHSRSEVAVLALISVVASGKAPWAAHAHHALKGLAGEDKETPQAWRQWARSPAALELIIPESGAEER